MERDTRPTIEIVREMSLLERVIFVIEHGGMIDDLRINELFVDIYDILKDSKRTPIGQVLSAPTQEYMCGEDVIQ